jgi:hypothetical protein
MRTKTLLVVAALFLLAGFVPTAAYAQRGGFHGGFGGGYHGGFRGGFHGGFHRGGGFWGWPSFGFGYGAWGPYYPYDYWYPYYGPSYGYRVDYGTVEFKVKPEDTQIFVDNKYMGRVYDLDHHKLYLPEGYHDIRLAATNGTSSERKVYVATGKKLKIDQRL